MADRRASIIITLQDLASSGLGRLVGSIEKFKVMSISALNNFRPLIDFLKSSVAAYLEQENANEKLNQALKNQGIYSAQAAKELQNFASELQRTTTFSDETIVKTQAMLTTFGLAGEQMNRATKAALDLSIGLGVDLNTAALTIGKAFTGSTETLGRYGIKIAEGTAESDKFNAVLVQLEKRFGGEAQARLSTTSGQIENLTNRLGELKERIGAELIPVIKFWADQLSIAVGWLEKLNIHTNDGLVGRELTIQSLRDEMTALIEKSTLEGTYHDETIQRRLANYEDAILKEQGLLELDNRRKASQNSVAVSANTIRADQLKKTTEDYAQRKKQEVDFNKFHYDSLDGQRLYEEGHQLKVAKINKFYNEERVGNLTSTLNTISTLSQAKNKELAVIGKASAISIATIDTFAAASKALASAPPPFNFALMAAVIAAGLANVARISGVQLAQGGMIMPSPGGTLATIGEASRPEVVLPLGDRKTQEALSESGFGGITINVGTLIADDRGIKELAKRIDESLFELRRTNESLSF